MNNFIHKALAAKENQSISILNPRSIFQNQAHGVNISKI